MGTTKTQNNKQTLKAQYKFPHFAVEGWASARGENSTIFITTRPRI